MDKLAEQIQTINQAVAQQSAQNVSFNGFTGSGKSSLICYLLNAQMKFHREAGRYLLEHEANPNLPSIGTTFESCTEIPKFYKKGSVTYGDFPGSLDSKGSIQQMANAYSSSRALVQGKTYKMVIVIEIGSLISARGGPLATLVQRLEELLGDDFVRMGESSCIVVSKVNMSEYNLEEIKAQVNEIISKNSYFAPGSKGRQYAQTILKRGRIMIFPLPHQITADTIKGIEQDIQQTPSLQLQNNAKVSLSPQAKLLIETWKNDTANSMRAKAASIETQIKTRYSRGYSTVPEAQNAYNLMTQSLNLNLLSRLANLDDFPIVQLVNSLGLGANEANQMVAERDKLKKLQVIEGSICRNIDVHSSLRAAITLCQSTAQNEINRINNAEALRRQREQQEAQRRERERRAEEERVRAAAEQARRARQLQQQQQRQAQAQRRQAEELHRRQVEEQQRLQAQINNYRPPPPRRRRGCVIM